MRMSPQKHVGFDLSARDVLSLLLPTVLHLHRQDGLLGWEARGFRERDGRDGRGGEDGDGGQLPPRHHFQRR